MSGYVEDEMLVKRAQAGDPGAFNALIDKHQDRAYRYAFRLTRDAEEAADVVAEAFVRVYNAIHNFRSQSTFTTWLYRILTNCFLDLKKKDKSKLNVSLDAAIQTETVELTRELEDTRGTPQDEAERNEREHRMIRAVGRLPEYQRALVVMYHSEMMSYDEIATALDMPVGTVKSRLNRARLTLRESLMRDEELFRI
jgi:RNA polymerase sigma-70 factor (ECF subfamily)